MTTNKKQPIKEVKEAQVWEKEKMEKIARYILKESKKQSPERKERNEILGKKYREQDEKQDPEREEGIGQIPRS